MSHPWLEIVRRYENWVYIQHRFPLLNRVKDCCDLLASSESCVAEVACTGRSGQERPPCSWKGEASYYDIVVDGQVNVDAAWYYPKPKAAAAWIKDYVAFWRGVKVES